LKRGTLIKELLTKDDFREAVRRGDSIVIIDTGRAARFHPSASSCDHVTFDGFHEKVVLNKGKHGGYFSVSSRQEAGKRWLSLVDCWGST
jgi:hypothetical protein